MFYTNNGSMGQPSAGANLGGILLIKDGTVTGVSGALPISSMPSKVYTQIIISATTWGDAKVTIETSIDGVAGWCPVPNINGTLIKDIAANTSELTVLLNGVFVRANLTSTSGAGINVGIY